MAGSEPLLLHMALATAPTSSIYHKPLLICRMRRTNGPEIVINAIPFGPGDHARRRNLRRTHQLRLLSAASRRAHHHHGRRGLCRGLRHLPRLQKRTGKNFAAFSGDYHAALCAAIRAGWRTAYTVGRPDCRWRHSDSPKASAAMPSRFTATMEGLERVPSAVYQQIRQARAAAKITRALRFRVGGGQAP